jgi:hypothetical protein
MDQKRKYRDIGIIATVAFISTFPVVFAKVAKAHPSPQISAIVQKFSGTWELVTSEFRTPDGKIAYPLGEKATGILI